MRTPSTGTQSIELETFDVAIHLYHAESKYILTRAVPVVASDTIGQQHEVLLGRDILADCLLVYNGPDRGITLAF